MDLREAKQFLNGNGYILVERQSSDSFEHDYEVEFTKNGTDYVVGYTALIYYSVNDGNDVDFELGNITINDVQSDFNNETLNYENTLYDGTDEEFLSTSVGNMCYQYALADINKKIEEGDFADEMDAEQERLFGDEEIDDYDEERRLGNI